MTYPMASLDGLLSSKLLFPEDKEKIKSIVVERVKQQLNALSESGARRGLD